MSFRLMPSRVPKKKGPDEQTDGQQNDPIWVVLFSFEVRYSKNIVTSKFLPPFEIFQRREQIYSSQ